MSFIKRALSSIGIGSAKVDTVLFGQQFVPGDTMEGVVKMRGGEVEQHIDDVYFSIHSTYEVEVDDEKVTRTALLGKFKLANAFVLKPGQEKEIPLAIRLPLDTPLTMGKTKVWLQTGLDIKQAIDPGDKDFIQVIPGRLVNGLFDALHQQGFDLVEVECEAAPSHFRHGKPFIQEFEFRPFRGPFQGRLDELEVVCFPQEDSIEVYLEVDRKARGLGGFLAEIMNADESRLKFIVTEADLPHLDSQLYGVIDSRS